MTPDCVTCRRQVCADHRRCTGELAALLERMDARRLDEEAERLAELADMARLRDTAVTA